MANILDPHIMVTIQDIGPVSTRGLTKAILMNVTCKVDAVVGTPGLTLTYIGSNGNIGKSSGNGQHIESHGYYYEGSCHETMLLPVKGNIICGVTDARGTYSITKPIVTSGKHTYIG